MSNFRYVDFSICRNVDGDVEFDMSIVVTSGIPLSHLPAPILVLKCNYKAVWPIRRLNYVLGKTAEVGLKANH